MSKYDRRRLLARYELQAPPGKALTGAAVFFILRADDAALELFMQQNPPPPEEHLVAIETADRELAALEQVVGAGERQPAAPVQRRCGECGSPIDARGEPMHGSPLCRSCALA